MKLAPIAVPLNYDARWVVDSGVRDLFATTAPNRAASARLNGAGVTAADADTPLNYTNNCAGFAHVAFRDGCEATGLNCELADFTQKQSGNDDATMEAVQVNHPGTHHRKMAAYFDLGGVGVETISADADAHGSHTAGTIDGDAGTPQVYNGRDGLAPAARHVHQETLDSSGGLATPTDCYELFRQAYRPSAPAAVASRRSARSDRPRSRRTTSPARRRPTVASRWRQSIRSRTSRPTVRRATAGTASRSRLPARSSPR